MTIQSGYTPVEYPVSGVGPYSFSFNALQGSIVVLIDDQVTSDPYTVSYAGDGPIHPGGSVTFDTAPTGTTLKIVRSTELTQAVDYQPFDTFPAETHEFALDKLTLISQEQAIGDGSSIPPGGPFLPLAGGLMDANAVVTWREGNGNRGNMQFINVLGAGAFVLSPILNAQNSEIGFVFQTDISNTKYMAGDVNGVWAIEGRPALSGLPDTAIALKGDLSGSAGDFLPLAGGQMDANAVVQWREANLNEGEQTFQNLLTVGTFVWGPVSGAPNNEVGYSFKTTADGTIGLYGDSSGVWALQGRPAFSTLPDEALATKADVQTGGGQFLPLAGGTMDQGALVTWPNDPAATLSSDADMGFINFFGINALRIQAKTASTTNGIGYLFLTDIQNEPSVPFFVGSKIDGFRVREQIYTDPDAITTRTYLEANTIPDAPNDANEYVRQGGAWVVNTGGSGGEANTSSNQGSGVGIALPKNVVDLPFKSLVAGTDVQLVDGADTITINYTGSGGGSFLPLAGGTMDIDATITMRTTGQAADFSFESFLGTPSFWFRPVAGNMGFVVATSASAGQPVMSGSTTSGFVIENQNTSNANHVMTRALSNSAYAAVNHTHSISQVTGLQAALDSKANATDLNNYVTVATTQNITGAKTFTSNIIVQGTFRADGGSIFNSTRLQGVADPINPQDAATRAWVEANFVAI